MDSIRINGTTSSVESSLVQRAEADPEVSARLLKKAMQSDKDLVATLLPSNSSRLDIRA